MGLPSWGPSVPTDVTSRSKEIGAFPRLPRSAAHEDAVLHCQRMEALDISDGADDKSKKLAHQIRISTESQDLDLAGYGGEACAKLCEAAFAKPLPLKEMIRFSFTVGGGKKVRQKYNDGLPALLSDALKKVGFSEDRGASCDISCAGMFKFQHNTDTDLKVTHVFPRIDPAAAEAAEASDAGPDPLSPKELIIHAEMATFQKMIQIKTPSLDQKRKALECLKAARAGLAASEEKLASMQPLTDEEQNRYDTLDAEGLEAKQAWLSKQLELMIDQAMLTAAEKETVLAQLGSKIELLETQLASAEAESKAKRVEKLQQLLTELRARSGIVREAKPAVRKVKFEAEIKAAQKRLAELTKLENSKVVLPLAEVQKLQAKPKLLEDLAAMQAESKGWFAD